MKERPLIFSPWSVRRILEDKKTETRRTIDVPICFGAAGPNVPLKLLGGLVPLNCPLGNIGDGILVKEPWLADPPRDGTWPHVEWDGCKDASNDLIPEHFRTPAHVIFRASWTGDDLRWRNAMFMPRWASRLILELTDIRVERLQDISEESAIAEGIQSELLHPPTGYDPDNFHPPGSFGYVSGLHAFPKGMIYQTAKEAYRELWDSLHIKNGHTWDTNPFVWIYKFRRVQ